MTHRCKVLLNTKYDNHPATIEVIVKKKSIYNGIFKNNATLEFDWMEEDFFKMCKYIFIVIVTYYCVFVNG